VLTLEEVHNIVFGRLVERRKNTRTKADVRYLREDMERCLKLFNSSKIKEVINILKEEKELLLLTKEYIKEFNVRVETGYLDNLVDFRGDEGTPPSVWFKNETIEGESIKGKHPVEIIDEHVRSIDNVIIIYLLFLLGLIVLEYLI